MPETQDNQNNNIVHLYTDNRYSLGAKQRFSNFKTRSKNRYPYIQSTKDKARLKQLIIEQLLNRKSCLTYVSQLQNRTSEVANEHNETFDKFKHTNVLHRNICITTTSDVVYPYLIDLNKPTLIENIQNLSNPQIQSFSFDLENTEKSKSKENIHNAWLVIEQK